MKRVIVCANPACGKTHPVRDKRQKHCSVRCANVGKLPPDRAAADRGRAAASAAKRRATLAALEGLTPLQAFRRGYMNGLRSKLVQLRRHYHMVRKTGEGRITGKSVRHVIAASCSGVDLGEQTD